MTRNSRNDKRKSFVSMYQYDIQDSGQNGYHSKYLKLVGGTFTCTFIGILIFIQLQKPVISGQFGETNHYNLSGNQPVFIRSLDLPKSSLPWLLGPGRKSRPEKESDQIDLDAGRDQRFEQPWSSSNSNDHSLRGFRKWQWQTIRHVTTSKQTEVRQRLKNIQLLISDLKYFPR